MWCMEISSSCCSEMNIHIDLRRVSQIIYVFPQGSQATCTVFCGTGDRMEPMKGKWASSRFDLGYTNLFCTPEVHQYSSRFVTVFLGTLLCSIKKIEAPYMFDWEYGIALHAIRGIEPHFPARGMSHMISRVAAITWGI